MITVFVSKSYACSDIVIFLCEKIQIYHFKIFIGLFTCMHYDLMHGHGEVLCTVRCIKVVLRLRMTYLGHLWAIAPTGMIN